jgi:hypothetical protein
VPTDFRRSLWKCQKKKKVAELEIEITETACQAVDLAAGQLSIRWTVKPFS